MDVVSHGVQGGLIGYWIFKKYQFKKWFWWIVSVFILFGSLPDILGWAGRIFYGNWKMYLSAHHGEIFEWLKWIPSYYLHTCIDLFCHKPLGGWSTLGWVIEAILVPATIYLSYITLKSRHGSNSV